MRVAVFGTRKYDRAHLEAANRSAGHDLRFLEPGLDAITAPLAEGCEAVCASRPLNTSPASLLTCAQLGSSQVG